MSIFFLFDCQMKMFHKYVFLETDETSSIFVFVQKVRSITRGANFKCFEPEVGMHFLENVVLRSRLKGVNSVFGKRKLHTLK